MKTKLIVAIAFLLIVSVVYAKSATREDAVQAIEQAKKEIKEMEDVGFSVKYVNDILTSAEQALERADFAEVLRKNAVDELAEQAKKALEGLDYKGFTYDEVLKHTEEISTRKKQAYGLSDSIRALEIKIEDYRKSINISEAESILEDAKIAFEKERYDETEDLLSKANSELEDKKAEFTTVNIIVRSGKSFFEKNWFGILVFSIVAVISGWLFWRRYRIKRIRDNLKKMKIEEESLQKLMKKTQMERFKREKISDTIYRIRMDKYNERLNEIRGNVPVLEEMLKKKKVVKKQVKKREGKNSLQKFLKRFSSKFSTKTSR